MDRRSYLGALAAVGVAGTAGCLDGLVGGDSATALGSVDDDDPRAHDLPHPTHGDEFPSFSIPDPLTGETISNADFAGERAFLMTFIFTSCVDECGTLVRTLQLAQADAADRGYEDDVAFLAMTFDPETDDADALRSYGEDHDVDFDAGNWHFLRPETQEEALEHVNDTFGSPVRVRAPDDHEHDHNGDDEEGGHDDHENGHDDDHENGHDDEQPEPGDGETTTHYYMIFLVNEDGVVERSYPNAAGRAPVEILEDTRTVVE